MKLPSDVAAYLTQAAKEIANEQEFQPESEQETRDWMQSNFRAIGERARELMEELRVKLANPQTLSAVVSHISDEVYARCNAASNGEKKWNSRYVAYATAHGCTPDEMLKRDGNMVNYLCWRP